MVVPGSPENLSQSYTKEMCILAFCPRSETFASFTHPRPLRGGKSPGIPFLGVPVMHNLFPPLLSSCVTKVAPTKEFVPKLNIHGPVNSGVSRKPTATSPLKIWWQRRSYICLNYSSTAFEVICQVGTIFWLIVLHPKGGTSYLKPQLQGHKLHVKLSFLYQPRSLAPYFSYFLSAWVYPGSRKAFPKVRSFA